MSVPALAREEVREPSSDAVKRASDCLYEQPGRAGRLRLCIRKARFNRDLCAVIGHLSTRHAVPPDFFARLIWRESLFRPEAVSPKGAEGIAQFMPSTARMRGLDNTFDVIAALDASAAYLRELKDRFGNFGYAAAAYNAGERGLGRFLENDRLPFETRDYVFAITGETIETWRDKPPKKAAPALEDDKPFLDACTQLAETRRINEPVLFESADWAPWGVQLAAHFRPAIASRAFTRAVERLPAPFNQERAILIRQKRSAFGRRPRYAARIGRETRKEADALCGQIRAFGGACVVLRN